MSEHIVDRLREEIAALKEERRKDMAEIYSLRESEESLREKNERLKAENKRLRRDAERYRWLLNWLVRTGLLTARRCQIDAPETYGDWYVLRKPYVIDGRVLVGYGKTEDAAIDAAMKEAALRDESAIWSARNDPRE